MKAIKRLLEGHKFFTKKSQHYIMGDWNKYQEWFPTENGLKFNKNKYLYYKNYIPAYVKFMWMTLRNN